jgi:hypothetical protein
MTWAAAILAMAAIATPSLAVEWHVNPAGTGDAPTIQAAFDLAAPGDVILLAPGVYRDSHTREVADWNTLETTTSVAFMKPGVSIIGELGAEHTTIDGEDVRHGLVGADLGTVQIRGITFLDGRSNGTGNLTKKGGAGAIIFRTVTTVEDCVFRSCIAPDYQSDGASGLYLIGGSQCQVRRNLFVDNYGGDIGGAMGILEHLGGLVEFNTFVRNEAADAGGAIEINSSTVTLRNNIFAFNKAWENSGAILCLHSTVLTTSCNLFWENDSPIHDHAAPLCVPTDQNENLIADPIFCDADSDVFTLRADSPGLPWHPSGCGFRGAYGIGCGIVSVEQASWGEIKASYR